jgi:CRP/FNR family cyclic AMP-dependent transcriptional regulator
MPFERPRCADEARPAPRREVLGETTNMLVREVYERTVDAGDLVFDQGDPGDVLFVIQAGEIELTREGTVGRRVVARLGPGEFFGEMSVVLRENRTARAVAVSNSRLLELDGETLEAMCVERPEIAIRIISRLSTRLIDSERRLAALGVDDLLRPVVRTLVRAAVADPKHGMRVPTTLRALADDSGLSILEAHRALHQLLDQKLVRLVDDVIMVKDVESLSASLDAPA